MQFLNWLLFSFKGRLPRKEFWFFQLGLVLLSSVMLMIWAGEPLQKLAHNPEDEAAMTLVLEVASLINLVLLWPKLAVDVKRMHDRNRPAFWILIQLIPLIGPIWFLIEAGVLPGTPGDNRYGPPMRPSRTSPSDTDNGSSGSFDA